MLAQNARKIKKRLLIKSEDGRADVIDTSILKEGILSLSEKQQIIVEMLAINECSFSDVCIEFCLSAKELNREIATIRNILMNYI